MTNQTSPDSGHNPLSSLFRRKDIFVTLPSNGRWYKSGINLSIDGDLGVMPMTVKDELYLKSPDAIFNGDAVVQMIRSCAPDIQDPLDVPACDLDPIIIGIKAASEKTLSVQVKCPNCSKESNHSIDLLQMLSLTKPLSESDTVSLYDDTVIVTVKPYSLATQIKQNIQSYHHTQLERLLNDPKIDEERRKAEFAKSLKAAIELSFETVVDNIVSVHIKNQDVIVNDRKHIIEWVDKADRTAHKALAERIKSLSVSLINNEVEVECGCQENKKFKTRLDLNPLDFFT